MIAIAIVDDEAPARAETARIAALAVPAAQLRQFATGAALRLAIERERYAPTVAILDIQLHEQTNGIDLAKTLNTRCPACAIVFLADQLSFATEVYTVRHSWFLLKSQREERLPQAIEKALSDVERKPCLHFRSDGGVFSLDADEITYAERSGRVTKIHTSARETFDSYDKPAALFAGLEEQVVCCHQSFWVNLGSVRSLKGEHFTLRDGTQIPVSRSRRRAVHDAFMAYLLRRTPS